MKKGFIITILLATVILTGCSTKGEVKTEEIATEYFDFTVTEFNDTLKNDYHINLEPIMVIDDEENGGKIATYTRSLFTNLDEYIHYRIHYDETTGKVSYISFSFEKSILQNLDLQEYYIHIGAIANIIEPNIDTDKIYSEISIVDGKNADYSDTALYKGEKFNLLAYCYDTDFTATFTPTNNTKGD